LTAPDREHAHQRRFARAVAAGDHDSTGHEPGRGVLQVVADIGQNARLKFARFFFECYGDEAGGIPAVCGQVVGDITDRR